VFHLHRPFKLLIKMGQSVPKRRHRNERHMKMEQTVCSIFIGRTDSLFHLHRPFKLLIKMGQSVPKRRHRNERHEDGADSLFHLHRPFKLLIKMGQSVPKRRHRNERHMKMEQTVCSIFIGRLNYLLRWDRVCRNVGTEMKDI